MEWLSIVAKILGMFAIAFLLGWTEKTKNPFSPFTKAVIWIGSILALLAMRIGWDRSVLCSLLAMQGLASLPGWVWLILVVCVGFWFTSLRIAYSTIALAQEIEQTNARIEMLENSIKYELREIGRERPDNE
jgi:hypothetical protein